MKLWTCMIYQLSHLIAGFSQSQLVHNFVHQLCEDTLWKGSLVMQDVSTLWLLGSNMPQATIQVGVMLLQKQQLLPMSKICRTSVDTIHRFMNFLLSSSLINTLPANYPKRNTCCRPPVDSRPIVAKHVRPSPFCSCNLRCRCVAGSHRLKGGQHSTTVF